MWGVGRVAELGDQGAVWEDGDGFGEVFLKLGECLPYRGVVRLFQRRPQASAARVVDVQTRLSARQWMKLCKQHAIASFARLFDCPGEHQPIRGALVLIFQNLCGQRWRQQAKRMEPSFGRASGVGFACGPQMFEGGFGAPDTGLIQT